MHSSRLSPNELTKVHESTTMRIIRTLPLLLLPLTLAGCVIAPHGRDHRYDDQNDYHHCDGDHDRGPDCDRRGDDHHWH